MALSSIAFFVTVAFALALIFVASAPSIERRGGQSAATGALISALILFVLILAAGFLSAERLVQGLAAVSAAMLVWAGISYMRYRNLRSADLADIQATKPVQSGANCRSRLTMGEDRTEGLRKRTWRTHLFGTYSTAPSNGELKTLCRARGGAYYVLYFTGGLAEATPTVTIMCEDGDSDGSCLADASETGSNDTNDPPVRVRVVNSISASGSRVRVATVMGAALNASGGPSVSFSQGGLGVSLTFPDASLADQTAMGTYRWICEDEERFEEILN